MSQPTRIIDASKIDEISLYLSKSGDRQAVYRCIYSGGARPKSAREIAALTGLGQVRVSQLATPMANNGYAQISRKGNEVFYAKYRDLVPKRDQILSVAKSAKRLKAIQEQKTGRVSVSVRIAARERPIRVDFITIDDIDNFAKAKAISFARATHLKPKQLREEVFKYGLASILGETGTFQDWGGEKNDLYTAHLRIKGKRVRAAVALKGRATPPPLTLKKLGKNANQIPHLFESAAEVFLVQFEGQISEEVVEQMETYAIRRSKESGKLIRYGIIAGEDSARLRLAYPKAFEES